MSGGCNPYQMNRTHMMWIPPWCQKTESTLQKKSLPLTGTAHVLSRDAKRLPCDLALAENSQIYPQPCRCPHTVVRIRFE